MRSGVPRPSVNHAWTGARTLLAAVRFPCSSQKPAKLVAARSSHSFACCCLAFSKLQWSSETLSSKSRAPKHACNRKISASDHCSPVNRTSSAARWSRATAPPRSPCLPLTSAAEVMKKGSMAQCRVVSNSSMQFCIRSRSAGSRRACNCAQQ